MREDAGRGLVLVVEDEPAISDLERLYLTREGFRVQVETDGLVALEVVGRLRPVAVVLDVGLPGLDGVEVLRALRRGGDATPVLLVTARDDEVERVLGLELGADDYVTKPFSPRELVARVRAVLRRGAPAPGRELVAGPVRLDPVRHRCFVADREVALTATEFTLLEHLLRHVDQVLTRRSLLAAVWGYAEPAGTRTVDVHVAQLRAKLGPQAAGILRTVRGVGYAAQNL